MRTVVVITGASSGIGEEFARQLAPEHDLILVARRKEKLEEIAEQLGSRYDTKVGIMAADLTNEQETAEVARRIENVPNLALLVNNAGFGAKGLFWETPLETQEQMHKLHVMAAVRLSYAALRNMVPRNFGAIINVSSVAAFARSFASYSATKSWAATFTEGLHVELQSVGSHVQVQALCPGFTYSEFHDAMGVNRYAMAPPSFWMTAEQVVSASLEGLGRRKLFVIPGWRYRLLTAFFTKVPTNLRVLIEQATMKRRISPDVAKGQISEAGN
jgi:uncharacterized protein